MSKLHKCEQLGCQAFLEGSIMCQGEECARAPLIKLCCNCKHAERRPLTRWVHADCARPGLPMNLIDATHKFPLTIARGYTELCGPDGKYWEKK